MTAKSRAALASDINTYLTSNSQGAITGPIMRDRLLDLVDSSRSTLDDPIFSSITMVGDANYTILPTDLIIGLNATLTAPRTWTLPAASARNPGGQIIIIDLVGGIGSTNTLTVAKAGTNTLVPTSPVVLSAPYSDRRFITDGTSRWLYEQGSTPTTQDVTHTDPNTGATPRPTFQILRRLPITPQDFPTLGSFDGVGDDTAALQAAANASMAERRAFRLPGMLNNYVAKQTITFDVGPPTILGDGMGVSRVVWPADATSVGFNCTPKQSMGFANIAEIGNFSLLTARTGGVGLTVNYDDFNTFQPDGIHYATTYYFQPRMNIHDLWVSGTDILVNGFDVCVDLIQPSNTGIDRLCLIGRINRTGAVDNYYGIAGLRMGVGRGFCSAVQVSKCIIIECQTGIATTGFEGVLITHCQIFGVENGITLTGPGGVSHYTVSYTHINADSLGILLDGVAEADISHNDIYKISNGDNTSFYGVVVTGAFSRANKIVTNNLNTTHPTQAVTGISVRNGAEGTLVDHNTFRKPYEAAFQPIEIQAGAIDTFVGDSNVFIKQAEVTADFTTPKISDAGTRTRRPGIRVRRHTAADIVLTPGTPSIVSWGFGDENIGGMGDNATPTRFTVKVAGEYVAAANIRFGGAGTGSREAWMIKNGALGHYTMPRSLAPVTGGAALISLHSGPLKLAVGDYIEVTVSASDAASVISGVDTWFSLTRIGETQGE
jgi:hypothetical protein